MIDKRRLVRRFDMYLNFIGADSCGIRWGQGETRPDPRKVFALYGKRFDGTGMIMSGWMSRVRVWATDHDA